MMPMTPMSAARPPLMGMSPPTPVLRLMPTCSTTSWGSAQLLPEMPPGPPHQMPAPSPRTTPSC